MDSIPNAVRAPVLLVWLPDALRGPGIPPLMTPGPARCALVFPGPGPRSGAGRMKEESDWGLRETPEGQRHVPARTHLVLDGSPDQDPPGRGLTSWGDGSRHRGHRQSRERWALVREASNARVQTRSLGAHGDSRRVHLSRTGQSGTQAQRGHDVLTVSWAGQGLASGGGGRRGPGTPAGSPGEVSGGSSG